MGFATCKAKTVAQGSNPAGFGISLGVSSLRCRVFPLDLGFGFPYGFFCLRSRGLPMGLGLGVLRLCYGRGVYRCCNFLLTKPGSQYPQCYVYWGQRETCGCVSLSTT